MWILIACVNHNPACFIQKSLVLLEGQLASLFGDCELIKAVLSHFIFLQRHFCPDVGANLRMYKFASIFF